LSRIHFRVFTGDRTLYRLTIGRNLEKLRERTQAFASACPDIACQPLFFHRAGGWDYLAMEFFAGRDLESLSGEGRLTPMEIIHHAEKIVAALQRTEQPSNAEEAAHEIDLLFSQVCVLPLFIEADQSLLKQAIFPLVRIGALAGPHRTCWTNGDLIPRNVLVDQQDNVRLVDYEFATRTHFFAEEAWRWRTFSILPPEARDLPGWSTLAKEPWLEALFLLQQLVLAHEVNGADQAALDSHPAIERLAVLAGTLQAGSQPSVFLQSLAATEPLAARVRQLEQSLQEKELLNQETLDLSRTVVADALNELTRLRDLLYQREEKIRAMQASFSWQVTKPLRSVRRKLLDRYRLKEPMPPDPARLPIIRFSHSPRDFSDTPPNLRHGIDRPHSWDILAGSVQVQGWCFGTEKIQINAVRARLGDQIFAGTYGQPRPDIAVRHSQFPPAKNCGFTIDLMVAPGETRLLVIEAGDERKNWHRLLTCRPSKNIADEYIRWVREYDTLTPALTAGLRAQVQALRRRPLISVLMPVYNTPEKFLLRAIDSVRAQIYENWELCIADDASTAPHIRPLLEKAGREDPRIKVVLREKNGHISAASNSALELAQGEFVALLDHDDELRPHALACVAFELDRFPGANLIYSDEDKITEAGFRYGPYFKPDWNPDLLLAQNFICHLGVYRTALVRDLGGFRTGCEGSQDWDLALRASERTPPEQIRHIPRVLYHWRAVPGSTAMQIGEKNYSIAAAKKAIADHFSRMGLQAGLTPTEGHYWRVHYPRPDPAPRVTLAIPTRNRVNFLRPCLDSILQKTTYPNYEILVVDNDSDEPETIAYLDQLRRHARCRVIAFPGPFNFSALNNFAARQTDSPLIGLLNNDLEVINADWLDEMATQALRPEIGCVGAKLYYPDGRIQHAGVILGLGRLAAGHAWHGYPGETRGQGYRALLQQNLSAVTAACLVIRREVYLQVGGLDEENFRVALNDVDFCLKVRAAGYRNLYTPFAELYHYESASRGYEDTPEKRERFRREAERLRQKWGDLLFNDPAYNPNLTLDRPDFGLAFPPRVPALDQAGRT